MLQRILILVGVSLISCQTFARSPKVLATFTLHEDFGVSHPEQIVYFEAGPKLAIAQVALLDEAGNPAPFQMMHDHRIAVRTGLPAGTNKTWRLVAGGGPIVSGLKTV